MAKSDLTLLEVSTESLFEDLRTALVTPVEALRCLAENLDTDRGFRLRDEARAIKSWSTSGLAPAALKVTRGVLKYLFEHAVTAEKTPDELLAEIQAVCSAKDIPGFEERQEALRALLTPSDRYLERRVVVPWTHNVFPILTGLDASAELRAAYRSASSEELLGLIPMAILRIATKHDDDEDSQVCRYAMQLTEEDVDRLISKLELSKRRLSALKRYVRGSHVKIHDDLVQGQWKTSKDD